MGLGVWNQEWLNENAQRKYPLSELATGMDTTGTFTLPDDFIVDMIWSTHADITIDPTKYQILSVIASGQIVTVTFAYDGTPVTSISIQVSSHTTNKTYQAIGNSDDFYDDVIRVTIGNLANLLAQPPGSWTFDVGGGRIESTVIRSDIRGVTSITLRGGPDLSEISDPLQDEIELAAGNNMRLTVSTVEGRQQIRIDAIDGEGLNDACDCSGVPLAPPIRTINGIPPNSNGNFQLQTDDCLEITSQDSGILIEEKCASPCCGCQELQVVQTALNEIETRLTSLESFEQQLSGIVDQMMNVILVSKLGTEGDCT